MNDTSARLAQQAGIAVQPANQRQHVPAFDTDKKRTNMTTVDFDLFKKYHLIVEGDPIVGSGGAVKWTITGENQDAVENAGNKLMRSVGEKEGAQFSFPGSINNKADPHYGWYKSRGITAANEKAAADFYKEHVR